MKRTRIVSTASKAVIAGLAVIGLVWPGHAKLSSTKTQESNMVNKAAPVAEKWLRRLNNTYGKNDTCAKEAHDLCKEIGGYEDGILNDMAIASDVARLLVYAQRKDALLFRAIDDFDRAADQLGTVDQRRYYVAKAMFRSECSLPAAAADSVKQQWLSCLVKDCCRASRSGCDAEKSAGFVRHFTDKNSLKGRLLDESSCRITQEYARYFVAEAAALRRRHDDAAAFKIALRGIKEIPALTPLDTMVCARWKSQVTLLSLYDSLFVRPLAASAGASGDEFNIEVCGGRNWQYRQLVAAVLVRIRSPSSDAFDLFEKAGKDDILQHDGRIAVAEMRLWKKAGKLNDFRKKFPERFDLAHRTLAVKTR
jgi:hypothetical protein